MSDLPLSAIVPGGPLPTRSTSLTSLAIGSLMFVIVTATLLAVAGWLILPARRRKLAHQLEETIAKLNADLAALLSANFEEQLTQYERQLLEVIEPYERFLSTEGSKVERAITELRAAEGKITDVEARIEALFPEEEGATAPTR